MKNLLKIILICLCFQMVITSCQKKEKQTPIEQKVIGEAELDIEEIENEAIDTANSWLKLVDSGEYSESWEEAAKLFKGVISKENWEKTLSGVNIEISTLFC